MDSTVCTALLVSALGPERVVAVHIDNGFMRQGESAKVKESLEALGLRLNGRQLLSEFIGVKNCVQYQITTFAYVSNLYNNNNNNNLKKK